MAYGTPTDPVAGTVITVAYAVANFLDPIRALRAFTGGADPPGTGYVVTSDSTSATSWKTMLAAIQSAVGGTPVKSSGDTMSGNLVFSGANGVVLGGSGTPSNIRDVSGTLLVIRGHNNRIALYNTAETVLMLDLTPTTATFAGEVVTTGTNGLVLGGAATPGKVYDSSGTTTVIRSHNNRLGVYNFALTQLMLDVQASFTQVLGEIRAATAAIVGAITAASITVTGQLKSTVATGTAPLDVASTTEVPNLNAAALSGQDWHPGLTDDDVAGVSPSTTFLDTGAAVTLDRAGTWFVIGHSEWAFTAADGRGEMRIVVNGVAQTPLTYTAPANADGKSTTTSFTILSASNGHVAKIQVRFSAGAGIANIVPSRISAIWLAP